MRPCWLRQAMGPLRARRVHLQNPYATTNTSLLNAVATANRCKVIYFDRLAIATIVGLPLDIDQVEMLFVSLLVQATRAMTEAGAGQAGSFDRSARFHRSFPCGICRPNR